MVAAAEVSGAVVGNSLTRANRRGWVIGFRAECRRLTTLVPSASTMTTSGCRFSIPSMESARADSARHPSSVRGPECLDQLLHTLDHHGWWSVFRSLRARQLPARANRSALPSGVCCRHCLTTMSGLSITSLRWSPTIPAPCRPARAAASGAPRSTIGAHYHLGCAGAARRRAEGEPDEHVGRPHP